ncbi:hypothetical protein BDV96DRAFT_651070 [Lophiotrema nucula]|uniref:Uncharacterized protein n=1 Tax=Lophiotrema nucula TaxID=690887 RepID=A0A6A5YU02_9PLEO|nr:hypothetical protein BDV96DRAFT_651070 [Lophiotrema nucula]
MNELFSYLGLQFYILTLEGTLKFSISRNGKQAQQFDISDTDFVGDDSNVKKEDGGDPLIPSGKDASAVGLLVRLIKNDGVLSMDFDGKTGGSARWTFDGLDEVRVGPMYATAKAQTRINQTPESEIQAQPSETNNKRKWAGEDQIPNKRARSSVDSEPWPNHLFMEGIRTYPKSLHDSGKLRIDLADGSVWYTSKSSTKNKRKEATDEVDLSDRTVEVCYQPSKKDSNIFTLTLTRSTWKSYQKKTYTVFEMHIEPALKSHRMWSSNDLSTDEQIFFTDPAIIVDAIVHCIDRTSAREQIVHDPQTADLYRKKIQECKTYRDQNGTLPIGNPFGPSRKQLEEYEQKEEEWMKRCQSMRRCISSPAAPELQGPGNSDGNRELQDVAEELFDGCLV